ncbi:crossover junction endodeoxyribonuclease RuvC [Chitinophagaceae bacterium LB-8]|uniref:Crossover junction endodeoxyribonuclease RuvC n=1 Tax=Paraflavisolibacter caeni TaxID=2982496 RepID=A0A9X2XMP5_9BACT|nr:crossover junction endodeoxyribonuclease RuvC [Paraflavisolibacter caeni]MCU7547513.1 crossover junction endodeoxyribonuclease RuvC [Paraflavisolibacter caeni]
MQKKNKIILGIDPGTLVMGYSVIEICDNTITVTDIDVLKLSSKKDNYLRLQLIHQKVCELVAHYRPNEFAIESPFFGKNVQSMMKLGRAQGVAIAAAMTGNIPVTEYSPKKVKQSITGNGNADKEQVWQMLQRITSIPDKPKYFDATDALAVAICHHFTSQRPYATKTSVAKRTSKSGWGKFIEANPERVV